MPKPNENHKKLQMLAGKWTGEETFHATPFALAGNATSTTNARVDLDNFFLISDHEQKRDGKVTYRGHGVYGYDTFANKFTMHWFDVMGCDPGAPATGDWNGNTLTLQHSHKMGHGKFTFVIDGEGKYTFKIDF
ncbi:MAG: DUF1579 family protein [Planctomycetes bacterium]|nr:DUF1579 family protein [Planctomycetota bacterium]